MDSAPRASVLLRRISFPRSAPARRAPRSRTTDDRPAFERTSDPRRQWRRAPRRATCVCDFLESAELSSGEKSLGEFLVGPHAGSQRFDIDVLVRSVRDVNGTWPEQQRLAPVREERNIRRICNGTRLKPGYGCESLRGNVRAELHIGAALGPIEHHFLDWLDVANQTEHDLRFRVRGNHVGLRSTLDRADVDSGLTQHRIRRQRKLSQRRQKLEQRLDRRFPELRIGGMSFPSARADRRAERPFRATGQLALGWLAIDEKTAFHLERVRRARTVGAL